MNDDEFDDLCRADDAWIDRHGEKIVIGLGWFLIGLITASAVATVFVHAF